MNIPVYNLETAILRARYLAETQRVMIGIVGAPGAGKSWLTERLVEAIGEDATQLQMDGFHLSNEYLIDRGMRERKGAWDTFDVLGYVALLARLRDNEEPVIFAPRFARELEESIGSAVPIYREQKIVFTEGNYLLFPDGNWRRVRQYLDEIWYLDVDRETRVQRLIARRMESGEDHETAAEWVFGVDMRNAQVIEATRADAHAIVQL